MVKTMVLMSRRTDLTHAEFRDYYERNHTVLGIRYFEFRKYIRNYVMAPGSEPVAFDVFSEFWQDSLPEVYAAMAGPVGDLMREDGNRFIDRSRHRLASCEETLLAGPPRGVDPTPTRKQALFLTATPGTDRPHFLDAAARWGAGIADAAAGRVVRVTMDRMAPFENAPFPYDAILSIWPADGAAGISHGPPPPGISVDVSAAFESCETPPEVLSERGKGSVS